MGLRLPSTPFTTAEGRAHFPFLHVPDTRGQYADGKYKITVSFPADSASAWDLEAQVNALALEHWGGRIPAKVQSPIRTGDDTAVPALADRVFIRAKTTHPPIIVDANKHFLPERLLVCEGDTVRVAMVLAVYDLGVSRGVTAYLKGVQLMTSSYTSEVHNMFG